MDLQQLIEYTKQLDDRRRTDCLVFLWCCFADCRMERARPDGALETAFVYQAIDDDLTETLRRRFEDGALEPDESRNLAYLTRQFSSARDPRFFVARSTQLLEDVARLGTVPLITHRALQSRELPGEILDLIVEQIFIQQETPNRTGVKELYLERFQPPRCTNNWRHYEPCRSTCTWTLHALWSRRERAFVWHHFGGERLTRCRFQPCHGHHTT